jgi:hypothetical protein
LRKVKGMADLSTDLIFGLVIVAVAAIAIIMFWRASGGSKKKIEPEAKPDDTKKEDPLKVELQMTERKVKVPPIEKKIDTSEVEKARSQIRTLTLKQEINSMVLRRLFEAEDEGEISREERVRLGKNYEDEMKQIAEDLKRSEMLISLSELESIREEIVKKFEESLTQTQSRIDQILKELKIEEPPKPVEEEKPKLPLIVKKRRVIAKKTGELEDEAEEPAEQEAEERQPTGKQDVESRLEQLKKEVMKELDELDKLELEN